MYYSMKEIAVLFTQKFHILCIHHIRCECMYLLQHFLLFGVTLGKQPI